MLCMASPRDFISAQWDSMVLFLCLIGLDGTHPQSPTGRYLCQTGLNETLPLPDRTQRDWSSGSTGLYVCPTGLNGTLPLPDGTAGLFLCLSGLSGIGPLPPTRLYLCQTGLNGAVPLPHRAQQDSPSALCVNTAGPGQETCRTQHRIVHFILNRA